jgi:ABC-type antimicrobial peptide transport system permease subunit
MLPYSEVVRTGIESILAHKLRSALTMLGVVFGVAAVVSMLSIGEGAKREATEQIKLLGTNNIRLRHLVLEGERAEAAEQTGSEGLSDLDRSVIEQELEHLQNVSPLRFLEGAEVAVGGRLSNAVVIGTDEDYDDITNFRPTQGRFLSDLDVRQAKAVCVIGSQVSEDLFRSGNAMNRRIRIDGQAFTVVGVMESKVVKEGKASVVRVRDINRDVYIPVTAALKRFTDPDRPLAVDEIAVQVSDPGHVMGTAEVLKRIVTRRHHGAKDFEIVIPAELLAQSQRTQRVFNVVMGSIAAISLLVGGIGIMNIMLANVTERTSEIGLRRAIGASERDVVHQFLSETVLVSVSGGVFGIVIGVILALAINVFAGWETAVSLWSVVLPFVISAVIGIGFGVYPAMKAARLDPATALRHE